MLVALVFALALVVQPGLPTVASAEAAGGVPADAVLAELPFQPSGQPNRVIVDLAPDGSRPFRLMLDTGASLSVMTPGAARDAGVSIRRTKSDPYRRATRLGRDLMFHVDVRSSDTASKTGWEYGLLGGDFLSSYVIELDFEAERVRFLDPEKFRVPEESPAADALVLPLEMAGTRPVVKASVNGHEIALLVDTGAPWTLVLAGPVAAATGVAIVPDSAFVGRTVLGPMDLVRAGADRLSLGGHELGPVPLLVAPNGWYNQGTGNDSVLGAELLGRFLVRLDYPRRRLWLQPRSPATSPSDADTPAP